MTEYTFAVIAGLILVYFIDRTLKTHVLRFSNRPFWKTAAIFAAFQLVFDNLCTFLGIWKFNSQHVLGIFVPFIPIENLIFGFELLSLSVILYEFFARARAD
jgi:lycopene cyclase domain-containing protein